MTTCNYQKGVAERRGRMSKKIHVRPSGAQSKVGFAVGIIFCLIGLFVAIPTFGVFGIFWTAIAGWITYVNWRNGFSNEKIDSHVIEIEDMDKSSGNDIENRLKSLQSLYDQRLITKEEYEEKKCEILSDL